MGFRLGRRALGVADTQIASDSFRALVNGIELPPYDVPKDASNGEDVAFHGDGQQLTGRLIAPRATPCAPPGPAGLVTLSIRSSGGHSLLQCNLTNSPAILLYDLGSEPASFSYSEDGSNFSSEWSAVPGIPGTGDPGAAAQYRKIYIRLANASGSVQMLALASTGRPITWSVFDPKRLF
jgi:hypothetical protein